MDVIRSVCLQLSALQSFQILCILKFIFHALLANLHVSVLGDNGPHCPGKSLPLFLFALLPVILPEVVVRLENRQFLYVLSNPAAQTHEKCVFQDAERVVRRTQPSCLVLDDEGFDGAQAVESSFLELDNFLTVGGASFGKYVQDGVKAFFTFLLPSFDSVENFLSLSLVVSTVDPKG